MASDTGEIRVTRAQALFVSWVMDVLVYIVVLGLFVEYVPSVITESFIITIFTAVVLKLLIEAIARLEHRVGDWFKRREGSGVADSQAGDDVLHPLLVQVRRP